MIKPYNEAKTIKEIDRIVGILRFTVCNAIRKIYKTKCLNFAKSYVLKCTTYSEIFGYLKIRANIIFSTTIDVTVSGETN